MYLKKEEVTKLLGLGRENVEVTEVKTELYKGKKVKMIYIKSTLKKCRCPGCGEYSKSIHDTLKPSTIKYLDIAGWQGVLKIRKRRFNCKKCNKSFVEKTDIINKGCNISNKVKVKIHQDLKNYNLSIDYIAKINHVSAGVIIQELERIAESCPTKIKHLPEIISIDEFKADTKEGKYAFIINDPIKKQVLDVLPSRKKEYLINYFTSVENRKNVKYVIGDMYEPYLLVTNIMFPKAKYIADRFHYSNHVMEALDDVRIRIQDEYGYNSKIYRKLKNKKNVSLLRKYSEEIDWFKKTIRYRNNKAYEYYTSEILNELKSIHGDLEKAYQLKELFLEIINKSNYENAKSDLLAWIELCKESGLKEFEKVSNTIENWLEYIVNSFMDKRFSNGYTEGLNNKIKVMKRIGFGYKKFKLFRGRILYAVGNKIK